MDLSKYRQLYVSETQENLDELARRLIELESTPDDREHIDTVFRLFHSIKGMSGTMGYTPLFELAHQLEELMDRVRRQTRRVDAGMVDVLLAGVDRMGRWVADVEAQRLPIALDESAHALHRQIRALLQTTPPRAVAAAPRASDAPAPEPGDLVVELEAAAGCPDPGMRGFVLHRKLAGIGQVRGISPGLEALREGRLDGPLRLVLRCAHAPEKVEQFIRLAPEWARVSVSVVGEAQAAQGEGARASAASDDLSLDGLDEDDSLDDLLDLGLSAPPPAVEPEPAPEPESSAETSSGAVAAAIVRPRPTRTIRVRTDWLDTLLDRVGDLLILSQRMWAFDQEDPRPQMTRMLGELSRLLGGLHADALSVRMTSLSVLTDRLPRVVRDLCRQVGKRASLVVRGDDQRVDRAIIEGLDAPLTHLLRNAVEHGVEPPDMREERGKSASGLLVLECRRVRDEIVVELRDDGQGIDRRHLARRAVRMGLLDEERAMALAERDLVRLVCLPGLSSRETAGRLAGRGVGMDAVHDAVTALGGRVEVESAVGEGTTVTLHLPRTPGISRLLLVEAGGQVYGLPLNHVRRTGLFDPAEARELAEGPAVRDGDEMLPLWSLTALLGGDEALGGRRPGIVTSGRRPGVMLVDRIVGQQDALLKPLGPLLERIAGLSGVTLDAEGHPVFVLDVPRLVDGGASPGGSIERAPEG